jgi:hypothetical protein
MSTRRDYYAGVPREWRDNRVYTGIVSCKSMRPRGGRVSVSIWEVRKNGETIARVSSGTGISRKTIALGESVARECGLYA